MSKKLLRVMLLFLSGLLNYESFASHFYELPQQEKPKKIKRPLLSLTPQKVNGFIRKGLVDSYHLWENVLTIDSLKVVAAVLPFYLIGRKADAGIHRQFYDAANHRNIHQPPGWMKDILTDELMAIPFTVYGALGWFSSNPEKRRNSQVFAVGLFWTWTTKVLVKQMKTDSGLRPWHEEYSSHKRSHGGNPSGHTSMATFMATYVWLTKGPKWGVPLTIYAGLVGGISTASNHHYVSQVAAGAGLGVIMGFAAEAVLNQTKFLDNAGIELATDNRGGVGLKFFYNF